MNFVPYISTWAVLAVVVMGLGIYRMRVARHDDDTLDVIASDPGVIAHQKEAVHKIKLLDRWGQALTVLAILYGLVIAGLYLYHVWQEGTQIQMH
jgi:hypothetical protein